MKRVNENFQRIHDLLERPAKCDVIPAVVMPWQCIIHLAWPHRYSEPPQETDNLSILAENKSRKVEASIDSLVESSSGESK